jgi:hypothetical protein
MERGEGRSNFAKIYGINCASEKNKAKDIIGALESTERESACGAILNQQRRRELHLFERQLGVLVVAAKGSMTRSRGSWLESSKISHIHNFMTKQGVLCKTAHQARYHVVELPRAYL